MCDLKCQYWVFTLGGSYRVPGAHAKKTKNKKQKNKNKKTKQKQKQTKKSSNNTYKSFMYLKLILQLVGVN